MVVDKSLAVVDIVRLPYLALFSICMFTFVSPAEGKKKPFHFSKTVLFVLVYDKVSHS